MGHWFHFWSGTSYDESACNAGDLGSTPELGREDPLEKEMTTHSSILACRIPWREEEPGVLQSMGSRRVRPNWVTITLGVVIFAQEQCWDFPDSSVGKEYTCKAGDPTWFDLWVRKIHWRRDGLPTPGFLGFSGGSAGKESACNAGDLGSVPGLGRVDHVRTVLSQRVSYVSTSCSSWC